MPQTSYTRAFHNRLALVFDFDETLAPDSYDAVLRALGEDPEAFDGERVQPLLSDGFEEMLARAYCIVQASREGRALTRELIREVAEGLDLYPGVPELFDRVRGWAQAIVDDVEVEFYVLTAGFYEVACAVAVADEFSAIWGSAFHFNDAGRADFVRQVVSHPEKVRYLLQLAKGLEREAGSGAPEDVWRDVPEEDWHVPLSQMIYLGDGDSDMPAFDLVESAGGIALGIFKGSKEDWEAADKSHPGRRVHNLAPAGFSEGSELLESVRLSVEAVAKRIALRRLGRGE